MAVRDVNLYKFIGRALKHKFIHPEATDYEAADLGYPSMEYGSIQNQNSIFGRIYNTFITLSKDQHLNLNPYLNLEDREILERLYLNLKKDPNLKFLDNPDSVLKDAAYELSDQYYQEQQTAAEQAEPVSGMADTGGKPVTAVAGGIGLPTIPSIPRIIHKIEQAKPPETFKGAVTTKAEILTQESPATAKIARLNPAPTPTQTPSIKTPAFKTDLPPLNQSVKTSNPQPIPPQPKMSSPRRLNFSAFKPTASSINTVKNFTSPAGIFFKKNSGRIAGGLGEMARGIGRTIVGPGVSGIYNLGARAGVGSINAFANFSNQVSGRSTALRGSLRPSGKLGARVVLAGFLAIFLFIFVSGIGAGIPGTTSTGEASPIGGGSTGTDISSCKFTRSDQGSPTQFKSSTLLNYIQEAAQKSSIPPVVLASFIRVESPSSSNMSNDQIINYSASCAQSPTGALGIMQIQPPGTTSARGDPASCVDCIDAGAKLVGKTAASMTTQDYCDPKTNIIVGAGWILKKMSKLGYGDGTKWDAGWTNNKTAIAALVNTYYGCLKYGSADDNKTDCADPGRKYSYADDVSTSIQNCQVSTAGTIPVLPPGADYTAEIAKNFHINFEQGKFTQSHLKWAWEILSQARIIAPNFFNLIGTVTADTRSGIGERSGNTIYFSTDSNSFFASSDESGFKVLLIHELGHVIRGNPGPIQQSYDGLLQQAINKDGGFLTGYGQNPCTGTSAVDEDFAETVAYYINKGTPEKDLACGQKSSDGLNPLYSGRYPNHMSFIQSILGKSP